MDNIQKHIILDDTGNHIYLVEYTIMMTNGYKMQKYKAYTTFKLANKFIKEYNEFNKEKNRELIHYQIIAVPLDLEIF